MFIRRSDKKNLAKNLPTFAVVYGKKDHNIEFQDIDRDAIFIVNKLQRRGFEAFIVGGAVRDLLLKKKPKDFDIVTNARPIQIRRIFQNSRIIGKRFRLVHVFFGKKIFEVSTFRSIEKGTVGNDYGTIEEDVLRRDFTLNALYLDPMLLHIVDFVKGMNDIKNSIIRPNIPLNKIFSDDPVRMIRAVKSLAQTNFHFSLFLGQKIKKSAELLKNVSASRLSEEIMKILKSSSVKKIYEKLFEFELLENLQSQVAIFWKNTEYHEKFLTSLEELEQNNSNSRNDENIAIKLSFLIRDFVEFVFLSLKKENATMEKSEIFSKVAQKTREFIAPLVPPREVLFEAVKISLEKCNIKIVRKRRKTQKNAKTI